MKKLETRLGLGAVVALSVSSMLGSGIFVLPGIASAKTGASVWIAYLVAGLSVLPAALSKGELASAMPASGGSYIYLDRAFGPLAGTIAGLGLWLSLLLKSTFALIGLGQYLTVIADLPLQSFAASLVVGIVALNIRGIGGVSRVQSVITTISVTALASLAVLSTARFDSQRLDPLFANGLTGLFAAAGFVFVSYAGVTKVAAIAEEIDRPEKNLPLGILLSLFLVGTIYGAVTLVLVGCLPGAALATDLRPIYTLATAIGYDWLGVPVAVIAVLTLASMANAGVLAASRFPFAMSRDDLLPPWLGRLHGRYLTPTGSILLTGAVMIAAIFALDVERLAKLASAFMIMIYVSESVAVIALREAHLQWYEPRFRSPGYPLAQLLGIGAGIALLVIMGGFAVGAGLMIGLAGVPLFFVYGRRRTNRTGVISNAVADRTSSRQRVRRIGIFLSRISAPMRPSLSRCLATSGRRRCDRAC